jgi:hypothetical protein
MFHLPNYLTDFGKFGWYVCWGGGDVYNKNYWANFILVVLIYLFV